MRKLKNVISQTIETLHGGMLVGCLMAAVVLLMMILASCTPASTGTGDKVTTVLFPDGLTLVTVDVTGGWCYILRDAEGTVLKMDCE